MDLSCLSLTAMDTRHQIWELVESLLTEICNFRPLWLNFVGRLTDTTSLEVALRGLTCSVCLLKSFSMLQSFFGLTNLSNLLELCPVILLLLFHLIVIGCSTLCLLLVPTSIAFFFTAAFGFFYNLEFCIFRNFDQLRLLSLLFLDIFNSSSSLGSW